MCRAEIASNQISVIIRRIISDDERTDRIRAQLSTVREVCMADFSPRGSVWNLSENSLSFAFVLTPTKQIKIVKLKMQTFKATEGGPE